MNLEFSYDIYWDTKIVKTVDQISILAEKYFEGKDYGCLLYTSDAADE